MIWDTRVVTEPVEPVSEVTTVNQFQHFPTGHRFLSASAVAAISLGACVKRSLIRAQECRPAARLPLSRKEDLHTSVHPCASALRLAFSIDARETLRFVTPFWHRQPSPWQQQPSMAKWPFLDFLQARQAAEACYRLWWLFSRKRCKGTFHFSGFAFFCNFFFDLE